jgi:hypothetical protein
VKNSFFIHFTDAQISWRYHYLFVYGDYLRASEDIMQDDSKPRNWGMSLYASLSLSLSLNCIFICVCSHNKERENGFAAKCTNTLKAYVFVFASVAAMLCG